MKSIRGMMVKGMELRKRAHLNFWRSFGKGADLNPLAPRQRGEG